MTAITASGATLGEPYRVARYVGEIVEFDPDMDPKLAGQAFKVEKVNPRSIDVTSEQGLRIRTDHYMLQASTLTFTPVAADQVLTLGTCVAFKTPTTKTVGTFAVIATKPDTVNLALLGGDDGRYFRSIPRDRLEVIDPSEIAQVRG